VGEITHIIEAEMSKAGKSVVGAVLADYCMLKLPLKVWIHRRRAKETCNILS
jgi:hypothetical protein